MKPNKLTLPLLTGVLLASLSIGTHASTVSHTDDGRGVNQWTEFNKFKASKTRTQVQEELRQAHYQGVHFPKEYQDPAQTTAGDGLSRAQIRNEYSAGTGTSLRKPGDIYYGD